MTLPLAEMPVALVSVHPARFTPPAVSIELMVVSPPVGVHKKASEPAAPTMADPSLLTA
jgi:hypothetical protein